MNDRPTVRTLDEFLARQAETAVRLSGAHHSSWNGQVVDNPHRDTEAVADWDGSLALGPAVREPLDRLFAEPGRQHSAEQLTEFRRALQIVLHENTHLLATEGTEHGHAEQAFTDPAIQALDEGATEAWAHQHLDDFITDLGLDEVAPGIDQVRTDEGYARFAPAVTVLAEGLGERTGLDRDEVLRLLAGQNAIGKVNVVTDMVVRTSDIGQELTNLGGNLTPELHQAVYQRTWEAISPDLSALHRITGPPEDRRTTSARSGERMLQKIEQATQQLPELIRTHAAQHQRAAAWHETNQALTHSTTGLARPGSPSPTSAATTSSTAKTPTKSEGLTL
ncbi:hypothetical protein [Kribbella amoyensis]|uniref:hypothetical protein n=1 Tax=Kribbella amoyensis TaxID=996641 RepID=UPI0011A7E73A|nr:hypothetical protein [Kribbella amoyensis]